MSFHTPLLPHDQRSVPPHEYTGGLQTLGDTLGNSWQHGLKRNLERRLRLGETGIAKELSEEFEQILIELALAHSQGHKQKAAKILGWGRNTLSRKLVK